MKLMKRVLSGTSAAVLSLSSLLTLGFSGVAHAAVQTCTWTGTGGDDKFSTAANWSNCGGGVPLNGDIISFDTAALIGTASQNVTLDIINDSNPTLSGVRTDDSSTNTSSYITLNVHFDKLSFGNNAVIDIGSKPGYQPKGKVLADAITASGDLAIKGTVTSGGEAGWHQYIIDGKYNVGGSIIADGSQVMIENTAKISGIKIANYGIVSIFNVPTLAYPIVVTAPLAESPYNSFTVGGDTPTVISGNITIPADMQFLLSGDVQLTGTITGGSITKAAGSTGNLTIGNQTVVAPVKTTEYADAQPTIIESVAENETATLTATGVRSSIDVYAGGVLKGTGKIQYTLSVFKGGVIAPGNSPGCLTSNSLSLSGEYRFELGGADPCTGYDQLKVLNTSDASYMLYFGADSLLTTSRFNGYTPTQGQTFTIIDYGGTKAVQGTFKGLPEGATFTQNGVVFKISYVGGTGNDVVLTVQNQPTAPDTGFALISANPLVTLGATAGAALVLLAMARKTRPAHARAHASRRRK